MIRYSEDHIWIKKSTQDIYVLGITEFGAEELGELNFIELPKINEVLQNGQTLSVVESVKAASDIMMPLQGTITEINEKLNETAELVNKSPEKDGWICKIKDVDQLEWEKLMNKKEYEKYCA